MNTEREVAECEVSCPECEVSCPECEVSCPECEVSCLESYASREPQVNDSITFKRKSVKLIHINIFLSIFGFRFWYMNRNLFGRFMFRYGHRT